MRLQFVLGIGSLFGVLLSAAVVYPLAGQELERLNVSENGRYLVTASGRPFFWLGDTCWHMFGKSVSEDHDNQPSVSVYFADRAAKGFTVIQSVLVREQRGSVKNAYGHDPFEDGDWSRPRVRPGTNDDYWDHVDRVIQEGRRHGIYLAILPIWLQSIEEGHAMEKDPSIAYRFGWFLGARYKNDSHIIWVLGGDAYSPGRNVDRPSRLSLVRAMAEGITDAASGIDRFDQDADWTKTFMTFHPPGGNHSSGEWLHDEPWLDFNMIQTTTRFRFANWQTVTREYGRVPPKPVLDAEVAYEDSLSLEKTEPQDRRIRPWDVRRAAYWAVFAGAFGHTYGHRSFIGWIRKGETYNFGAHIPWYESLDAPGAVQMSHLRRLMESRPFLSRIPDQSIIEGESGRDDDHLQATRDRLGRTLMVYSPTGKPIRVRTASLRGKTLRAWWFDPRSGRATLIDDRATGEVLSFKPPTQGADCDWVLVVDVENQGFPAPGEAGWQESAP